MVGVKPAGGIRTTKDAIKYLVTVNEIAGPDWLDPDWFRFGASTPAQRPADAAHQDADRPLLRPRLRHRGLTDMATTTGTRSSTHRRPSRARSSTCKASYGLFIDGEFVDGHGAPFKTINPGTEEVLAEVAEADEADVDRGGQGRPPRLHAGSGPGCPAASAASTSSGSPGSSRSARASSPCWSRSTTASRSRSPATSTSRSAAAHFFYYAGWADKLEYAGYGRPAAARRRRPGDPVELPAADAGLEDRAGAGLRQHRRAQAGRDHAADRAALRRDLPAGRPAAGRGQHRHRRRRHRPRPGRAPGRRQGRLHRLDRRRQGDRPGRRRHRQEGHPRARRQGRQHRLRRRPARPGRRGHRQRHLLQPGPRLLRRLAPAGAGVASPTRCSTRLKRRMATLRVGDPLDKNTDVGAINSAEQLAKIRELSDIGEEEGAERWSPPCELPDHGFWFAPTLFTGVTPGPPDRPRGDLRPGAVGADLPHAGGGGREGQQHAVRPLGRGLDRQGLADPVDGQRSCGPASSGPTPSTSSTRPARSAATRSRATAARAAATAWRPTCDEPATTADRRPQDLQALHRRRVPALGVGPLLRRERRQGTFSANAALASRKDARDAVVAARAAFAGWSGRTAYNRGQVLYRVAEVHGGPRDRSSSRRSAQARA